MSDQLEPRPSLSIPSHDTRWTAKLKHHWQGLVFIASLLACLAGGIIGVFAWVDSRVEKMLSDSAFLAKIGNRLRPDLLIDSAGTILADRGAMDYLDDLQAVPDSEFPTVVGQLTITPKKFMALPPLITSVDGAYLEVISTRGKGLRWTFSIRYLSGVIDTPTPKALRVEIMDR